MIKRFKRWRNRSRLRKGLLEATRSQLLDGEIDIDVHDEVVYACNNKEALNRTLDQLETQDGALGQINWTKIKEWIIENWPQILKLLLSVLVILDTQYQS